MAAVPGTAVGRPARATLPVGVWLGGRGPIRELTLRPVGAADEAFLLDTAGLLAPAERATALLARCIVADDAIAARDPTIVVEELTAGDREAALLHLRRATLGERLECVISCPAVGCGERLDFEIAVADLLVPPDPAPRREHSIRVGTRGKRQQVRFRLPKTSDLAAAAEPSRIDPELGAAELLRRCLIDAGRGSPRIDVDELDQSAVDAISAAMAEHDPQAEIELETSCPACGGAFSVLLDAGAFLLQELDARAARLLEDVHALAFHYHWSEKDILALPPSRRERYLELLAATLGGSTLTPDRSPA